MKLQPKKKKKQRDPAMSCTQTFGIPTSFPFYNLPLGIVQFVTSEFLSSLEDVVNLDSATCNKANRALLMATMSTMHNCHFKLVTTTYMQGIYRPLDWALSRKFSMSKLTVCPLSFQAWKPSALHEGKQITVQSVAIWFGGVLANLSHSLANGQSNWSRLRWSELEWDAVTNLLPSDGSQGHCIFDEPNHHMAPIDGLTRVKVGVAVLSRSPRFLLDAHLKYVAAIVTDDSFVHWMNIIWHSRASLQRLELTFDGSEGSYNFELSDCFCGTTWPALLHLEVTQFEEHTPSDRLIVSLLEGSLCLRSFKFNNTSPLSEEVAAAFLKHVIWRPRAHEVTVHIEKTLTSEMLVDLDHLLEADGINAPTTSWHSFFPLVKGELWKYLPRAKQRVETVRFGKLIPKDIPAECFESIMSFACNESACTPEQMNSALSSLHLECLRVDGASEVLMAIIKRLVRRAEKSSVVRSQVKCRAVCITLNSKIYSCTEPVLEYVEKCFGGSLFRFEVRGIRTSLESVAKFLALCRGCTTLSVDAISITAEDIAHSTVEMEKYECSRSEQRARHPVYFSIVVEWPEDAVVSWETFQVSKDAQKAVIAALLRSICSKFRAHSKRELVVRTGSPVIFLNNHSILGKLVVELTVDF